MSGLVVDRIVSPARSRPAAAPSHWVVLIAVALGVLFGAIACAAGLAAGTGHGAPGPSVLEAGGVPMAYAGHLGPTAESGSQPTQPGDHSDHSGSTSTAGSHPGMACVVSVDLHFPETSSVSISDSYEIPQMGMSTGCPADVDPPVPRFS